MAEPIEIDVWQGDIAELEVDAVVVAASESLFMTAGAATSREAARRRRGRARGRRAGTDRARHGGRDVRRRPVGAVRHPRRRRRPRPRRRPVARSRPPSARRLASPSRSSCGGSPSRCSGSSTGPSRRPRPPPVLVPAVIDAARSTPIESVVLAASHASEVRALSGRAARRPRRRHRVVSADAARAARDRARAPRPRRARPAARRRASAARAAAERPRRPPSARSWLAAGRPGGRHCRPARRPGAASTGSSRSSNPTAPGAACRLPLSSLERLISFVGDVLGSSSLRLEVGPTLDRARRPPRPPPARRAPDQPLADDATRAGWPPSDERWPWPPRRGPMPSSCSAAPGSHARPTRSRASRRWPRCRCSGTSLARPLEAACRCACSSNDPLAGVAADAALDAAHRRTATLERLGRSRIVVARARAVRRWRAGDDGPCPTRRGARPWQPARGGDTAARGAASMAAGRSAPARRRRPRRRRRSWPAAGRSIGPELFTAAADLRADSNERTMVMAANRLVCWPRSPCSSSGSVLALAGVIEPTDLLLGIGGR